MDLRVRGVDGTVWERFRARASAQGKVLGAALTEAMELWLAQVNGEHRLADIPSWDWGPGTEGSSEEIDGVIYGKEGGSAGRPCGND